MYRPETIRHAQAVFDVYVKHGRNGNAAARELGITRERVRQLLLVHGIESIKADREAAWNCNGRHWKIREMVRLGKSVLAIAAELGMSPGGRLLREIIKARATEYAFGETPVDRRRLLVREAKEKQCGTCGKTKPKSEFSPGVTTDGFSWRCKPCAVILTQKIYQRRKAAGLCGLCGRALDRTTGQRGAAALCKKCIARNKKWKAAQ